MDHLTRELPRHGVRVEAARDIEYGHEIPCHVDPHTYRLVVSFDWVGQEWWEAFFAPRLTWLHRLLGKSEADQLRRLSDALDQCLRAFPGVGEIRWYAKYGVPPDGPHRGTPLGD